MNSSYGYNIITGHIFNQEDHKKTYGLMGVYV